MNFFYDAIQRETGTEAPKRRRADQGGGQQDRQAGLQCADRADGSHPQDVGQHPPLQAGPSHLHDAAAASPQATSWVAGIVVAVASNLVNNLPMGLIAAATNHAARAPPHLAGAILIGVDLGPNLSVTGSLATILWLIAVRKERLDVSFWAFLKVGAIAMP